MCREFVIFLRMLRLSLPRTSGTLRRKVSPVFTHVSLSRLSGADHSAMAHSLVAIRPRLRVDEHMGSNSVLTHITAMLDTTIDPC